MTDAWCNECFYLKLPVDKYRLLVKGDLALCPHCGKSWPKEQVKEDGEA